ncbi:MAG TPA: ribosome-associated translation inhibitor RaiA [Phycisphaeraceae bacterium]
MEITVSGKHIEITDAIRQYAMEKAAKLPRYFDRVQAIHVLADRSDSHGYLVEILVHVEHRDPFIARSHNEDLYACIDEVMDKMERQLTDHKEKLRNRKHPGAR